MGLDNTVVESGPSKSNPSESMHALKKQRSLLKGRLTRIENYIKDWNEESGITLADLEERCTLLDTCLTSFDEIQHKIELLADDDETGDEEARAAFEEQYFRTKALYRLCRERLAPDQQRAPRSSTPVRSVSSAGDLNSAATSQFPTMHLKLQPMEVPSFSGDIAEYYSWRDLFKEVIEQPQIGPKARFHYLRGALKEAAADIIDGLQNSTASYDTAWELLDAAYDNKASVIEAHTQALLQLPAVSIQNATALKSLLAAANKHIRALKHLEALGSSMDALLVTIVTNRLDEETKKRWKMKRDPHKVPCFARFEEFLQRHIQALTSYETERNTPNIEQRTKSAAGAAPSTKAPTQRAARAHHIANAPRLPSCKHCGSAHRVSQCSDFKELQPAQRRDRARELQLCYNCLGFGHILLKCPCKDRCRECNRQHHTLLHPDCPEATQSNPPATITASATTPIAPIYPATSVILSTAIIGMKNAQGALVRCRCLLDSGSQMSFITEQLVTRLGLKTSSDELKISGIGETTKNVTKTVTAAFHSMYMPDAWSTKFYVLPQITGTLPTAYLPHREWDIPRNIHLADDTFYMPAPVDVLIGADLFYTLHIQEWLPPTTNRPALQHTRLGWIFSGLAPQRQKQPLQYTHIALSKLVEKFWELDQCAPASPLSNDQRQCEAHFTTTTTRTEEGRYVVKLPIKPGRSPTNIGQSRAQARQRLLGLERRLQRSEELKQQYTQFMTEYQHLDHMECLGLEDSVPALPGEYYIPHHAVFKKDSTSTKLRVVFDASAKTTSGHSLNDILAVGPQIQDSLFHIILRFRFPKYVMTADVQRMYRQILVHPDDQDMQRILWRSDPSKPISVFKLKTVTYGTASAPYLATRCLQQVSSDYEETYPVAARHIRDFYVDDLLTGADTLEAALELQLQMKAMLKQGGFELKKWASNHSALLENVPVEDRERLDALPFIEEESVKTLGFVWRPSEDILQYDTSKLTSKPAQTKRGVLSQLASLYDPLGLVGPVVTAMKIYLQSLWALDLTWDTPLPSSYAAEWSRLQTDLPRLAHISVPRRVITVNPQRLELHAFADASEHAYGCCVYIRAIATDAISVNLLTAKSRVAPQKAQTLPRLELCAALLAVRLLQQAREALSIPLTAQYIWTDSLTTLQWIRAPARTWKTFVANRVAEIQEQDQITWRHIPTTINPADIISRGCTVSDLLHSSLWWFGPPLLQQEVVEPSEPPCTQAPLEQKPQRIHTHLITILDDQFFARFSDLSPTTRAMAWGIRFCHNARNPTQKRRGPLTAAEYDQALKQVAKEIQQSEFKKELHALNQKGRLPKSSALLSLHPYMDEEGILRVGGRLQQSSLPYDAKHQIILPGNHPFTRLLLQKEHERLHHGGAQLVLASIRQRFWPLHAKRVLRKVLQGCVRCFRANPTNLVPLMGQLPTARVEPARPFLHTGIDFCGPFAIKPPTRSNIKLKMYVAVFICMSTKATHLELVSALSTDAFLLALQRFAGRRGWPQNCYSDNGTNFQGAVTRLTDLHRLLLADQEKLQHSLNEYRTTWHFNPPHAPHFGGLWEAAVKSFKYHFKRVAALAFLTEQEFSTVMVGIEACLNSRPLTPLSNDPRDDQPLTPGHFLIGQPLNTLPTHDVRLQPMNRLRRWDQTQATIQHFWARWSKEYLSTLNPRIKWTVNNQCELMDKLVAIKEDNLPPLQWKLGRVTQLHPGPDGNIRVVTLRTATGTCTRPIVKVYPLPIDP